MDIEDPKPITAPTRQTLPFEGLNATVRAVGETVVLRAKALERESLWTAAGHFLCATVLLGLGLGLLIPSIKGAPQTEVLFFLHAMFIGPALVLCFHGARKLPFRVQMTMKRGEIVVAMMLGRLVFRRRRWALSDVRTFRMGADGCLEMLLATRGVRLGNAAQTLEARDIAEVLDDQLRIFQA